MTWLVPAALRLYQCENRALLVPLGPDWNTSPLQTPCFSHRQLRPLRPEPPVVGS